MNEKIFSVNATKEQTTNYGLSFRLTKDIDEFEGYDKVMARMQVQNCGYAVVLPSYDDPNVYNITDNEYDLDEIYSMVEDGSADTEICEKVEILCLSM